MILNAITFMLITGVIILVLALALFWAIREHRRVTTNPWNIELDHEVAESVDHSEYYCARYKYNEIPGPCITGQCSKCKYIEGYLAQRNGEIE